MGMHARPAALPLTPPAPRPVRRAVKACLIMYIIARRTHSRTGYGALSTGAEGESEYAMHARTEASYRQLRNTYLCVYSLAAFGDWIQGGFLYALYAEYGYTMRQIGLIFVVGCAPPRERQRTDPKAYPRAAPSADRDPSPPPLPRAATARRRRSARTSARSATRAATGATASPTASSTASHACCATRECCCRC